MSIHQLNFCGKDKVETAIERFKMFEPKEGYYLAFSGGKDSVVIKALADMAEVKYDAHYNVTSVDPPELVRFIKTFDDVSLDTPKDKNGNRVTMWNLIPKNKVPPTRWMRYCCKSLKETGGEGRFTVTGVRWAESGKRKAKRAGLEVDVGKKAQTNADADNPDNERMVRHCPTKGKHILNPIIDWTDGEVWEFIREHNIPYCKLYDEGYKRLGCIGCPMSNHAKEQLDRYPKFKKAYLRAFQRMLERRDTDKTSWKTTSWKTAEEVMEWWLDK